MFNIIDNVTLLMKNFKIYLNILVKLAWLYSH